MINKYNLIKFNKYDCIILISTIIIIFLDILVDG
jgi:hypothetical protein